MVNVLAVILITLGVAVLGGGGFYLLWLMTRPKKMYWDANVFQLGEGIKPWIRNKRKEVISKLRLQDLKPYTKDVIVRTEKKGGVIHYELQKLGKVVPAVTADVVEYWGEKKKTVDVLIHEDSCTLLKKGYDKETGVKVFQPLSHSRISQIKSEITLRKDRIAEKKDILQAITPWIVTGMAMLGLVAITYFLISGAVEISENLKEGQALIGNKMVEAARAMGDLQEGKVPTDRPIQEEEPPPIIE